MISKKLFFSIGIILLCAVNVNAISYLYICGINDGKLIKMDPESGVIIDTINDGGLNNAQGICLGPDNYLYVSSYNSNQILRYDREGNFIDVFSQGTSMMYPMGMDFGPDGYLYVASNNETTHFQILKVNPSNGNVSVFANGNPLYKPHGIEFGPDGLLYVCNQTGHNIIAYDVLSNTYEGVFIDGYSAPIDITFSSNFDVYVADYLANRVYILDQNGNQVDTLITGQSGYVYGLALDEASNILYVNNYGTSNVHKFDLSTKLLLDTFYTGANNNYPTFIEFVSFSTDVIPEPTTIILFLSGVIALLRKKNTVL
ncbi:MAG: NHL repeat-containing protein [Candidatus Auribacterota bacterium]|nr:NHL repeat-containing protein [Candidatus Auribacterota bacterium]